MFASLLTYFSRDHVVGSAKIGANLPNPEVPIVEGGILKDECDQAFWCAFSVFRDEAYYNAMIQDGHQEYIDDRTNRFKCKPRHDEL